MVQCVQIVQHCKPVVWFDHRTYKHNQLHLNAFIFNFIFVCLEEKNKKIKLYKEKDRFVLVSVTHDVIRATTKASNVQLY